MQKDPFGVLTWRMKSSGCHTIPYSLFSEKEKRNHIFKLSVKWARSQRYKCIVWSATIYLYMRLVFHPLRVKTSHAFHFDWPFYYLSHLKTHVSDVILRCGSISSSTCEGLCQLYSCLSIFIGQNTLSLWACIIHMMGKPPNKTSLNRANKIML